LGSTFGSVHVVFCRGRNERYAIKCSPSGSSVFEKERRCLTRLNEESVPNVPSLIDIVEFRVGTNFLAYDFIGMVTPKYHCDLYDLYMTGIILTDKVILRMMKQVLSCLQGSTYCSKKNLSFLGLHRCKLFHADLKPQNIMVKKAFQSIYEIDLVVIDFGLTKEDEPYKVAYPNIGTAVYNAPEIFLGFFLVFVIR